MKHRNLLRMAGLALGTAIAIAAHAAPHYRVTALGDLSSVADVNDLGQVLGTAWDGSSPWHPALYANGSITLLPSPFDWQAYRIDDTGGVLGIRQDAGGQSLVRYQGGTFTTLLNNIPAGDNSFRISTSGLAAGSHGPCTPSDCQPHAVLYGSQGPQDLGTLGGRVSSPTGINSAGHVIGSSMLPGAQETPAAFWYHDGQMTQLPGRSNVPNPNGLGLTTAHAINDHDQVVGSVLVDGSDLNAPLRHAALWNQGVLIDLGSGSTDSVAWDINNRGVVLGSAGGSWFLYENGQAQDFQSLVLPDGNQWRFSDLGHLTDTGYLVGYAYRNDEQFPVAVLLSPVPEPAQWALLIAGLACLAGVTRRRGRGGR